MPKNARFTAFTISELLRENQQGGKTTPPTQISVNGIHNNRRLKCTERSTVLLIKLRLLFDKKLKIWATFNEKNAYKKYLLCESYGLLFLKLVVFFACLLH